MKKIIVTFLSIFNFYNVSCMFLVPTTSDQTRPHYYREISSEEEEKCLEAYEKGINDPNNTDDLKTAIIGDDTDYKSLVDVGVENAYQNKEVNFWEIHDKAVLRIFSVLATRMLAKNQYKDAYFWFLIASLDNNNYLQNAEEAKRQIR